MQMLGSEKQVMWAEQIRAKYLGEANDLLAYFDSEAKRTNADPEQYAAGRADLVDRIGRLEAKSDARWWIDSRTQVIRQLLKAI